MREEKIFISKKGGGPWKSKILVQNIDPWLNHTVILSSRYLKNDVSPVEEEHVEDPEDEEEGELGGKEGEEPLAGVHLGGQPNLLQKARNEKI